MSAFRLISKQVAADALRDAAWTESGDDYDPCPNCGWHAKEPRTLIHCFSGSIGADWTLEGALELLERANRVAWIVSIFEHDLAIEDDERVRTFQVRAPDDVRDALLEVRLA